VNSTAADVLSVEASGGGRTFFVVRLRLTGQVEVVQQRGVPPPSARVPSSVDATSSLFSLFPFPIFHFPSSLITFFFSLFPFTILFSFS
jgi:hypothetical protein